MGSKILDVLYGRIPEELKYIYRRVQSNRAARLRWADRAEEINRRRRERYATDPEYRAAELSRSKAKGKLTAEQTAEKQRRRKLAIARLTPEEQEALKEKKRVRSRAERARRKLKSTANEG